MLGHRRSSRLPVALATAFATLVALLARRLRAGPGRRRRLPPGSARTPRCRRAPPRSPGAGCAPRRTRYVVTRTRRRPPCRASRPRPTTTGSSRLPSCRTAPTTGGSAPCGNTGNGDWATRRSHAPLPRPPDLAGPVDPPEAARTIPACLKWSAVTGASGYEVQVDTGGTFADRRDSPSERARRTSSPPCGSRHWLSGGCARFAARASTPPGAPTRSTHRRALPTRGGCGHETSAPRCRTS